MTDPRTEKIFKEIISSDQELLEWSEKLDTQFDQRTSKAVKYDLWFTYTMAYLIALVITLPIVTNVIEGSIMSFENIFRLFLLGVGVRYWIKYPEKISPVLAERRASRQYMKQAKLMQEKHPTEW